MKQTLTILFIILISSATYSSDGDDAFTKKYAEFRYSLFADLEKSTPQSLRNFSFNDNDTLLTKINEFLNDNKKEITAHREAYFRLHEGKAPDLASYTPEEQFKGPFQSSSFMLPAERRLLPFITLLSIEPAHSMSMLTPIAVGQTENTEALAFFTIKNSIGLPRITALRSSGSEWTIYADYFSKIFIYTFNTDTGDCSINSYLIRKNDKPK